MARRRYEFLDEEFLGRLQRLHLLAKHLTARGPAGMRRSRRIGDGLEFADHRSYAPGDDIRFIDWPYYARMEKLLLRLFHQRSEADVAILLDVSGSMAPGGAREAGGAGPSKASAASAAYMGDATYMEKFNHARRLAAALAFIAMGGLERVIVQPFASHLAEPLRTGRNRGRILEVLDFLAGLSPGGRTDLGRCTDRFARQAQGPATVLLVSDLLDCGEGLSDALAHLRAGGHETTVLHVYSPADARPGLAGAVLLRHAESDGALTLHITEDVRRSYRQRWGEFQGALERTAVARGATYVAAPTDAPLEDLVLRALRRAGVLAG